VGFVHTPIFGLFDATPKGKRQFDAGLISPFGPREARPKRRKTVPRAERFFAPAEFT
jgi:hypothetical protein